MPFPGALADAAEDGDPRVALDRGAIAVRICAMTRWQNFIGQTATLEATGEAFESKGVG